VHRDRALDLARRRDAVVTTQAPSGPGAIPFSTVPPGGTVPKPRVRLRSRPESASRRSRMPSTDSVQRIPSCTVIVDSQRRP
jgi:hypothetical protein